MKGDFLFSGGSLGLRRFFWVEVEFISGLGREVMKLERRGW